MARIRVKDCANAQNAALKSAADGAQNAKDAVRNGVEGNALLLPLRRNAKYRFATNAGRPRADIPAGSA